MAEFLVRIPGQEDVFVEAHKYTIATDLVFLSDDGAEVGRVVDFGRISLCQVFVVATDVDGGEEGVLLGTEDDGSEDDPTNVVEVPQWVQ